MKQPAISTQKNTPEAICAHVGQLRICQCAARQHLKEYEQYDCAYQQQDE